MSAPLIYFKGELLRLVQVHPLPVIGYNGAGMPEADKTPSHRRAKWLITRAFNLRRRRQRGYAGELRRTLAELDRYFMHWLRETRFGDDAHPFATYADFTRRGVPLIGDRPLPLWAMDVLLSLAQWAP